MESLADFLDGDVQFPIQNENNLEEIRTKIQEHRQATKRSPKQSPFGRSNDSTEKLRSMTLDIIPRSGSMDLAIRSGEVPAHGPPFFIRLSSKLGDLWFLKAEKFIAICSDSGNCEYFENTSNMIIDQKVFQTRERKFTIRSDKDIFLDIVFGSRKKITPLRAFLTCAKAASSIPPFGPTTQKFYETVLMNSDFFCCWKFLSPTVKNSISWDSYFYSGFQHFEPILEFAFNKGQIVDDEGHIQTDSFGYLIAKKMFTDIDTTWKKFETAITRANDPKAHFDYNFAGDKLDVMTRLLIHVCYKKTVQKDPDVIYKLMERMLIETEMDYVCMKPSKNIKEAMKRLQQFPSDLPAPSLTVFGLQSWFSLPNSIVQIVRENIEEFYRAMCEYLN